MNIRTLTAIWKANLPQWVWACLPFWIGSLIFALNGRTPHWGTLALFMVTVIAIQAIAEFANTYVDRDEDRVYVPSNPLVTGELAEGTAKKALILENVVAGLLLLALLLVTLNYYLIIAIVAGWFTGLAYSVPPLKLKETIAGPFCFALSAALVPIAACLFVGPLNDFMIAFSVFLFVATFGANISTGQLRKTAEALNHRQIKTAGGNSLYNLRTIGLRVKVKTAIALEAIAGLAAFILVAIFWHLGIFDRTLSIALLSLPLIFTVLTVVFRLKDPVGNARRCVELAGLAALFAMLSFFSVALTSVLHWHWGYSVLACIIFLIGFGLLFRQIRPYGPVYRAQQV